MSTSSATTTRSEEIAETSSHGRRRWRLLLILTLGAVAVTTAAVLFVVSGSDDPPALSNGDFESGDLTGWSTQSFGSGDWLVYEDGTTPPKPSISYMGTPFEVPDPPQGQYAAVTDMDSSGVRILYRDIEVTGPWTLHAIVFYENHGGEISDPSEFGRYAGDVWYYGTGGRNHQYRIDVIDPDSPIHSLEADDILVTVYRTQSGDPSALGPTPVTVDLSPWEGQTIRLRAAQIDNEGPMRAGIDDVRLERAD